MKIAITIEGQRGLTWPRWQRLATAVEELGFCGLYRSDHFLDAEPPDLDSLELWTSLTWLASHTSRIEFGPLVTPVSFRHPVHTARMAKEVDDLSGGRLILGLGAGWDGGVREHEMFGFDLLDTANRFARFEEGLQIISQLLREDDSVSLEGNYYQLHNARLLPRPQRPGGPPIMIGGNGPRRVLPLAACYADEWNGIFRTPQQYEQLNRLLDDLLLEIGRSPGEVLRSQMKGLVYGRHQDELNKKLNGRSVEDLFARGLVAGTAAQIVDQLGAFEIVGMQKVMLQWADLDDLDSLSSFAQTVLTQIESVEA